MSTCSICWQPNGSHVLNCPVVRWTPSPLIPATTANRLADPTDHTAEIAEVERLTALLAEVRTTAEHYDGRAHANGSAAILRILDGGQR